MHLFPALFLALAASAHSQSSNSSYSGTRHLWYDTPGTDFKSGLALGNGRIGALVLGSATERIILNENSVWSGYFQDRINDASLQAVPEVRELLMDNNITDAGSLVLRDMSANPTNSRMFGVTNDLVIETGHYEDGWTGYERSLDTLQGNAGVRYEFDGVNYSREFIAQFPTGIIAVRLNASEAGSLSITVSLYRELGVLENTADLDTGAIFLDIGGSGANSNAFSAGLRAVADEGAAITTNGSALTISGATTVDLFYDAETSFQWDSKGKYQAALYSKLEAAVSTGFDALRTQAIKDHSSLMGRVELDLGSSGDAALFNTQDRVNNYKNGGADADNELVVLTYQFGRHLLISSSRDTGGTDLGVPANLQGIWNDMYSPPWGGKYTVNINTEMNYWLAETTNLADTLRPLWDLMDRAQVRGADVAKRMYGCPGYMSHHNLDLWGDSAPHDNGTQWTMWPMSQLWLTSHMAEHYRFTGDLDFLKNRAWPLFQASAAFYDCYVFEFEGYTSSGPSISPENSFLIPSDMNVAGDSGSIDISPTMDTSLLHQFWTNVLEIADVLGVSADDDDVLARASGLRDGLRPTQIGNYSQIQEWRKDYVEAAPDHRHLSHLWDLFPGSRMSPLLNQTLADAARVSLQRRLDAGGGSTGWSRAWTAACFARLLDGDQAFNHTQLLISRHVTSNLFHEIELGSATFQIDSNFGIVAAVTEQLLQSHAGNVHLLPALPSKLASGSVSGLVARGGFVVSMRWEDGTLVEASVESSRGGILAMRVQDGVEFKINGEKVDSVETVAGQTYSITL